MVKKIITESSLKVPSNNDKNHKLDRLIKVLRPKVYITDSSSFKKLVQELTGNGASPAPPPAKPAESVSEGNLVVVEEESSVEVCNQETSFVEEMRGVQVYNEGVTEMAGLEYFPVEDDGSLVGIEGMESWVLDIDPFSLCNGYGQIFEEEVCIYDYDLSGLI